MRTITLFLIVLLMSFSEGSAQVSSPSSFLGYEPGERFTRHHDIVSYFKHVAEESPNVTWKQYGESYRNRPLFVVFVSSEENIDALDTIRTNNRRMAGLDSGEVEGRTAAIAWMSYGIHGNESSSPEAAMQTLYALARGGFSRNGQIGEETAMDEMDDEEMDDEETAMDEMIVEKAIYDAAAHDIPEWLEKTVVVIDPVLNPDGRERFVNWFDQTGGRRPDARLETREHNEPWPGGRGNHYYFDLNRDWAWQTQIESRQRTAFYHHWMPHVHADFHEMFRNDYYFPPAADPFHVAITPWQREFQHKIGDNHAARFDRRFERYFTREIFDLFYPGYGDTWPMFNGAIGMTYEQMGHSRAGTKMIDDNGDTLTLAERIRNHHEVGMSTIEVTAQNSERLTGEFRNYFQKAQNDPDGRFASYVISGENHPDKLHRLLGYLDHNEIRYEKADPDRRMTGRHYVSGEQERRRTADGDIVVSLHQPKSAMTRVLFDPDPAAVLADSNTYDITAWSLPYALGLDAWAVEDRVRTSGEQAEMMLNPQYEAQAADTAYAWIFEWGDVRDAAFVADLLQHEVRMSVSERSFTVEGRAYPPGSVVITRRANRHLEECMSERINELAAKHDRRVQTVSTGRADSGVDLGSSRVHAMKKPVVAVPSGDDVRSYHLGEIWHFFDHTLDYPLALFDSGRFASFPLDEYNILILPDGNYRSWETSDWDRVMEWVRDGGRLIAFSDAVKKLSEREDVEIALHSNGDSGRGGNDYDSDEEDKNDKLLQRFEDRRREALTRRISGAVFRVELDDSHPLAYGLGTTYATLKRGTSAPALLESGWNVGVVPEENALLGGWAGAEAKTEVAGSLMAGTKSAGRGQIVIFSDNPLFRGFWYNGHLLFSNAIFQAWIAK